MYFMTFFLFFADTVILSHSIPRHNHRSKKQQLQAPDDTGGNIYVRDLDLTTAASSQEPNIFDTILAKSSSVEFAVAAITEPSLLVTQTAPTGTQVLAAGETHTVTFGFVTNGTVSVMLEKQGALQIFSKLSEYTLADGLTGTTVTIPTEAGIYRIRFSLDGFESTSSAWDDVYFSYIVR